MAGLMELRRQILLATPHLETASGTIASFSTDMKAPIKRLQASFSPVQNLNGYDNPWPPGSTNNLFDEANATKYSRWFNTSNQWASANDSGSYAFACQPDTDYVVSAFNSELTLLRVGYIKTGLPTSSSSSPQIYSVTRLTEPGSVQIHTGEDATYIVIQLNRGYVDPRSTMCQIEIGTAASSYMPYSNICPITGWTGLNGQHTGENLNPLASASTASKRSYIIQDLFLKAGTYYVFSEETSGAYTSTVGLYVSRNGGSYSREGSNYNIGSPKTLVIAEDATISAYLYSSNLTSTMAFRGIVSTKSVSRYQPYNAQAISITFPAVGKNLFDKSKYQHLETEYDYVDGSYRCTKIQLKPNTTYTVSQNSGEADSSVILLMNNKSHVNDTGYFDLRKASDTKTYTTDETGCLYIGCINWYSDAQVYSRLDACKVQIELGSSASAFEPYTNTAYGGTLDVVSGVLTVEWASATRTWAQFTSKQLTDNYAEGRITGLGILNAKRSATICDKLKYDSSGIASCFYVSSNTSNKGYIRAFFNPEPQDSDEFTFVYYIATPITYTLDRETINTLLGINNIWTDANGQTAVDYWKHG